MTHMKNTNRHGFTLIELLVVISIITLLIAVLLPALRSARVAAQATQSLSQCRQIAFSLFLYANDNKSSLPYGRGITPASSSGTYWPALIYHGGYITTFSAFWGPGRDYSMHNLTQMKNNPGYAHWGYIGYGANYNGAMPQPNSTFTGYPPFRLDAMGNPPTAKHLLLVEAFSARYFFGPDSISPGSIHPDGKSTISVGGTTNDLYTHDGKLIRSYMDGHGSMTNGEDLGWTTYSSRRGIWNGSVGNTNAPWYDMRYPHLWN